MARLISKNRGFWKGNKEDYGFCIGSFIGYFNCLAELLEI